jgi:hypothetical protein
MAVWEDHLLSLLTRKDAARVACTCKALRVVVREHFRDLGTVKLEQLQTALTAFPRARRVTLGGSPDDSGGFCKKALLRWLRKGRRGEHLTQVRTADKRSSDTAHAALRRGALPSLKSMDVHLRYAAARASLTDGLLGAIQELHLTINGADASQLAALGLVRQLPALVGLNLKDSTCRVRDNPVQWPPFIPPSLRALCIDVSKAQPEESVLGALPGILVASGARLERLKVVIRSSTRAVEDGLVDLAQALLCCSTTLKEFHLSTGFMKRRAEDSERLRVQWADLLASVSSCHELQVLVLPAIMIEPLFPPGTAFVRLTHLEITDYEGELPPDGAVGADGVWGASRPGQAPLMA